jgi:hypothetical protein
LNRCCKPTIQLDLRLCLRQGRARNIAQAMATAPSRARSRTSGLSVTLQGTVPGLFPKTPPSYESWKRFCSTIESEVKLLAASRTCTCEGNPRPCALSIRRVNRKCCLMFRIMVPVASQQMYALATPRTLPKGTKLDLRASFDNSLNHRSNPDPTKTVKGGDQTFDEMAVGILMLQINPDTDFDTLFRETATKAAELVSAKSDCGRKRNGRASGGRRDSVPLLCLQPFVAPAASPDSEYELRHTLLYSRSSSSKPEYLVRRCKECSIQTIRYRGPKHPCIIAGVTKILIEAVDSAAQVPIHELSCSGMRVLLLFQALQLHYGVVESGTGPFHRCDMSEMDPGGKVQQGNDVLNEPRTFRFECREDFVRESLALATKHRCWTAHSLVPWFCLIRLRQESQGGTRTYTRQLRRDQRSNLPLANIP